MKVLLVATVQSHICQFHRPLADMLHAHGAEVHVAARNNLAEKNGLTLDFADQIFDVSFSRSPKSKDNFTAYRMLKRIISDGQYDVVHCNTPMGGIVARLAAREARKQGTKVYYTAHGFHFYQGAPKKNWLVFYPIEKWFADHYTDKVITITQEDFRLAQARFKCSVTYTHGVGVNALRYHPANSQERLALRRELGFRGNQKILLCVGELLPNKNQKMAINAMRQVVEKYPDAVLLLAGNGPEQEMLQREILGNNLQNNVKMLGYCTCLEKYQQIIDVLVACSKREGLPLNLVEALLSGNPIVATENRGHRELVCRPENGCLVKFNDVDAMAEAILHLLSTKTTSDHAIHDRVEYGKQFSYENVKLELERVYFA